MRFVSTAELKKDTNKIIHENEAGELLIITRHGKPCSILLHVDEKTLEQVLFEHSPLVKKAVQEGLDDLKAGRRVSLDDYMYERFKKR